MASKGIIDMVIKNRLTGIRTTAARTVGKNMLPTELSLTT
jgi:hypothetical protein